MKAITTKYHGPTNTRGSRITASDEDGNRVTVPVDNSISGDDSHDAAAKALCVKMGWTRGGLAAGHTKSGRVYVFVSADAASVSGGEFLTFTDAERATSETNEIKRSAAWRKEHGIA